MYHVSRLLSKTIFKHSLELRTLLWHSTKQKLFFFPRQGCSDSLVFKSWNLVAYPCMILVSILLFCSIFQLIRHYWGSTPLNPPCSFRPLSQPKSPYLNHLYPGVRGQLPVSFPSCQYKPRCLRFCPGVRSYYAEIDFGTENLTIPPETPIQNFTHWPACLKGFGFRG